MKRCRGLGDDPPTSSRAPVSIAVMAEVHPSEPEVSARWQRGWGRAGALSLASAYVLLCLVPLFYGVLAFDVRCGDDCGDGAGWTENGQAWQWVPAGFLGIGIFVVAAVLWFSVVARRRPLARMALAASAGCWIGIGLLALS